MKNWVEQYRPKSFEEYVFQDDTVKQQVDKFISTKSLNNLMLYGVRGTGKTLKAGDKVRLRISNGGASSYFWLRYAGGKITVVANDGNDVEPVEVDRLIIAVSETYDIEILNINSLGFNKAYYFNNKIIKNNILIFNNGFDSSNIFYFKIMEYKSLIFYDYRIVKYDYLFSNKDRITIVLKDL
jgi:DNA polymerase III delta prime subunit